MNKGGFSWQRLVGITAEKQRISRKVGAPVFSRSGRQAWVGRKVLRLLGLR